MRIGMFIRAVARIAQGAEQVVVGREFMAGAEHGAGALGAHDAVFGADQADRAVFAEVDALMEIREIGRVERNHDDAEQATVAGQDGARVLQGPFARGAPEQRLADVRTMGRVGQMDADVRPVGQVDRLEVVDRRGAQHAPFVGDADLHEQIHGQRAFARQLRQLHVGAVVHDALGEQFGDHVGLFEGALHMFGQGDRQGPGLMPGLGQFGRALHAQLARDGHGEQGAAGQGRHDRQCRQE